MELIILTGLQASGKTTFYEQQFAGTHRLVSKDRMKNNRNPQRRQMQLIEEALQSGQNVVVDNTNSTKDDREPLIRLGRQYGATVIGYYFPPNVGRSLVHNTRRSEKQQVPKVAIFATLKKLQVPGPTEGFDQLYTVSWSGQGRFNVQPLPPPRIDEEAPGSLEG